jgi:hypothetical protein
LCARAPRRPVALTGKGRALEPLPKTLPGAVCAQWVRCGRPNCRCARGELHGPYAYHFVRHNGRLRKRYVRQAEADGVRAACEARRRRQELAEWRAGCDQLAAQLREVRQP